MKKLKRNDKIYLDKENKVESYVNQYLSCRDGIVEVYEYRDSSGYGSMVRLFLCNNTKHEVLSIIRQTYSDLDDKWIEEEMSFDSDSFKFLEALIKGEKGDGYSLVRDY